MHHRPGALRAGLTLGFLGVADTLDREGKWPTAGRIATASKDAQVLPGYDSDCPINCSANEFGSRLERVLTMPAGDIGGQKREFSETNVF